VFETGQFQWMLLKTPLRFKELSADPANVTVPTNTISLYAKDSGGTSSLFFKDDAGNIHNLGAIGAAAAALTRVDDTNVTLTLGGSPTIALLAATSLTLGWTGTLSLLRGGTAAALTAAHGGVVYSTASALAINTPGSSGDWLKSVGAGTPAWTTPGALTRTDDTNVTLTLGGSPTTALLNATSLTLGWTGTLAVSRGGTNLSSYTTGDILYASGASTLAKLAIGSTGDVLTVASGLPSWAAPSSGGAGGHVHGLTRLVADGSTTVFNLLDIAEYIDTVSNDGLEVDALTYTLSADGSQVTFDTAPVAGNFVQISYPIMGI
jgi:hypothetical protein